MAIATKNGSIIVKDGKLAENCACCGGWYCCKDTTCAVKEITSVTIQMSAVGYFINRQFRWSCNSFNFGTQTNDFFVSAGFDGSSLTGIFSLDKQSDTLWSKSVSVVGGCAATLSFRISGTIAYVEVVVYASAFQSTDVASYKTLSQLSCTEPVNRWVGGWTNLGDEASQTARTSRTVAVSLQGPDGCFLAPSPAQGTFPVHFSVAVPYFTSRSCSEITSTGIVSVLESGSQTVSILGISVS
jgi:hypothetical protein